METNKQLTDKLLLMGSIAKFKPRQDIESESVELEVRRPAVIVEGLLKGEQIDIYDLSTFRAWTPHTKKAKAYAARYGLRLRALEGECELFVPGHLADEILPTLGAKVKRVLTEEQRARLKANGYKKRTQERGCGHASRLKGS